MRFGDAARYDSAPVYRANVRIEKPIAVDVPELLTGDAEAGAAEPMSLQFNMEEAYCFCFE